MSYDLTLSGSHRIEAPVRRRNPFTGENVEVHAYLLTEEELRAAKGVLSDYDAKETESGPRVVHFPDGTRLELFMGAAEDGERGTWSIHLRSLTTAAVKFLFDLAEAGNFVVGTDELTFTTTAATKERIEHRDNDCVVAATAEEVSVLLAQGFEAWQAFVDRAVAPATSNHVLLDSTAFDALVVRIFREAQSAADACEHVLVEPIHFVFAVLHSKSCAIVVRSRGLDVDALRAKAKRALDALPSTSSEPSHFSKDALEVVEVARKAALVNEPATVDLSTFMRVLASHGHLPVALATPWSDEERALVPPEDARPATTTLDTTALDPGVVQLLAEAQSYADAHKHVRVEPIHLALMALGSDVCAAVARAHGVDPAVLLAEAERALDGIPGGSTELSYLSSEALELVAAAERLAKSQGKTTDVSTFVRVLVSEGLLPSVFSAG